MERVTARNFRSKFQEQFDIIAEPDPVPYKDVVNL